MTTKFTLHPSPTFPAVVEIPLHGGGTQPVKMEFRHRSKDEVKALYEPAEGRDDAKFILEMLASWELEDELNEASVQLLLQNYQGAGLAIHRKYLEELTQARLGN